MGIPKKKQYFAALSGWLKFFMQLVIASAALIAVVYYINPDILVWQDAGLMGRIKDLMIVIAAGFITYAAGLLITGIRPHHLSHKE